jgi:predicted membrane protein
MSNLIKRKNNDGGFVMGAIILGIGILLLLRKLGFFFPVWLLSWPMILIVVGVFTLIKHEFKSLFGFIILGLGFFFLFEREFNFDFGLDRYIVPVALIGLGLHLISKKRKEKQAIEQIENRIYGTQETFSSNPEEVASEKSTSNFSDFEMPGASFSDRLNENAILSGVTKRILSKNLKGGKLTSVMGGIDLDLTQADISGAVYLQIDVIFGGVKLIVPPHWQIQTEVTNIAAGIEDNRLYRQSEVDTSKVLIIRGTILFGGLEIKSF